MQEGNSNSEILNRGSVEKTRIADSLSRVLVIEFDGFR
jgi:hypothetical protein